MDLLRIDGKIYKEMLINGLNNLSNHEQEINSLNVFPVPDGDTGTNMMHTLEGGLNMSKDTKNLGEFMASLSKGMLLNARGNSGVILSQLFKGQAIGLKDLEEAVAQDLSLAIEEGYKQAYKSVINPAEGTILTVARESIRMISSEIKKDTSINTLLKKLIFQMKIALDNTPNLLRILKEAGVVDSGGAGYIYIFEGMYKYICGETVKRSNESVVKKSIVSVSNSKEYINNLFDENTILTYGYCTEFVLQLQPKIKKQEFDLQSFIEFLNKEGDSIVALQDDLIVKVHIHTKMPGIVFNEAQKYGEFISLKSENMNIQHTETMTFKEEKEYAIITSSSSPEFDTMFKNFNVDKILDINSSSTNDFINAINSVNAKKYFILPNDKNSFLAVKQAISILENKEIYMIETKNVVDAYFALQSLMLEENLDYKKIMEFLNNSLKTNKSILISKAIKDSNINGIDIKNGDYIAFFNNNIIAASSKIEDVISKALDDFEFEAVSLFSGSNMDFDPYDVEDFIIDEYGVDCVLIDSCDQIYTLMLGLC